MSNLLLRIVFGNSLTTKDLNFDLCRHLSRRSCRVLSSQFLASSRPWTGVCVESAETAPGLTGHANRKPERARGSPEIYKRGEDLWSAAEVWRTHERFSFLVALIRDRRAALDWHYARVGADPLWQKALGVMRGNGRGPGPYLWGRRYTCNRPCAALAGLTCVPAPFWCRVDPVSSISTEIFPTASVLSWLFTFEFRRKAKSETTSCIFGYV